MSKRKTILSLIFNVLAFVSTVIIFISYFFEEPSILIQNGCDSLKYFTTDSKIDCMRYDENASNPYEFALIHDYAEGSNAYGVFLGGDQPLMVAKNPDGNGKKIAVVKESYGNAFWPFIAYTYSETHMIDARYAAINLNAYLAEHEIDEVIFINNAMASATYQRCEELKALVE